MKIIISPAKKMKQDTDTLECRGLPVFLDKTERLLQWMKELSYEELKKLWNCSDSIARLNYERIQTMDLRRNLTPALLAYEGIQYQYLAPAVLEEGALSYLSENLFILSGFYGALRAMDGVVPYRLEMQAKGAPKASENLYEFWKDEIYREVTREDSLIINLASKEYYRCLEKYRTAATECITCIFGEWKEGRVIQKGTQAKMARGEMVRYLARKKVQNPEEIKEFCRLGYSFEKSLSSDSQYVFIKAGR